MTDKILMDGEPLEVGDEVYSLDRGKGEIVEFDFNKIYQVLVRFESGVLDSFARDFKRNSHSKWRDLYWQKPEIIPPPKPLKPKKKVKVWDWYVEWVVDSMHKNGINRVNCLTEDDARRMYPNDLIQKIDGTEREVER